MVQSSELQQKFVELFGSEARVYRAPGRVNLIGEHTDYNDGFVMPAAVDFYTWVAASLRDDRKLVIHSENFSEMVEVNLDETSAQARNRWHDYPHGIARILEQQGHRLRGANLFIRGEVPIGSGLSSSAAIEVATGFALLDISGFEVDRLRLALACQRAENEFIGMRCGIMDQFISCFGQAGHALLLDCRSLDKRLLAVAEEVRLVICNTMVKHQLAGGEYNARRAECEAGVRHLAISLSGVRALRDVTLEDLEKYGQDLPDVVYRRCRHVISENARALEAAKALESSDLARFGQLMAASHQSLRDDYEVSCRELDVMAEIAGGLNGVYGARMTGGGFGGCTINLVSADSVDHFKRTVSVEYEQATGIAPDIYICNAAEGADRL